MERLERLNQMQSMDQMQTDDSETLGELESRQGCSSAMPCYLKSFLWQRKSREGPALRWCFSLDVASGLPGFLQLVVSFYKKFKH